MISLTKELSDELAREYGITYPTSFSVRFVSGPVEIALLEYSDRVHTGSIFELRETMDRIMASCGCTRSQACAAAFSVPDGAAISMAVDNVGCDLHPLDADRVETWSSQLRSLRRRFG